MLKALGNLARNEVNHKYFSLDIVTRSNIILLGLRKHKIGYRRSRTGTRLFHRIHSILSQTKLQHVNRISRTIGAFNQIIQTIGMKLVKTLHCGLVNCRSAVNKNT